MTGYTAPPQAYTRDTLVKAIDWIAHQPEALRMQATGADTLVALYLQSKRRNGKGNYPVSGEAFTEDLKSLAKDLEQFSASDNRPSSTPPPTSAPVRSSSFESPPPAAQRGNHPALQSPSASFNWAVDPQSWSQAKALKERLNLSSETEALRMMIALGSERLGELLP